MKEEQKERWQKKKNKGCGMWGGVERSGQRWPEVVEVGHWMIRNIQSDFLFSTHPTPPPPPWTVFYALTGSCLLLFCLSATLLSSLLFISLTPSPASPPLLLICSLAAFHRCLEAVLPDCCFCQWDSQEECRQTRSPRTPEGAPMINRLTESTTNVCVAV